MRIDRRFLAWGVFFLLVGGLPLAVRAGYVTSAQVVEVWRFWPLVIVVAGLGITLQRTRLEWVSGLLSSAMFGVFVGALLSGGGDGFAGFPGSVCGGEGGDTFATRSGDFTGGTASVDVELACGDLTMTSAVGSRWTVDGEDEDGLGPDAQGDGSSLSVQPARRANGPFGWAEGGGTWHVVVPKDPTLDVRLEVDAGSATVDLGGAHLGRIDVEVNAGRLAIDLSAVAALREIDIQGNAGSIAVTLPAHALGGSIEINAGSVTVCVPPDVGLRIETGGNALASYDFGDRGLVQDGSTWTSTGFDAAATRIDLAIQANAGSIRLDPEEGCGG